jgi:hypothetical protein
MLGSQVILLVDWRAYADGASSWANGRVMGSAALRIHIRVVGARRVSRGVDTPRTDGAIGSRSS